MPQGLTVTLTSAQAVAGDGQHGLIRVIVRTRGTGTAYLGGATVTTSGYPLTTGDAPLHLTLYQGETLYATSTGASILDILRLNETT